QSGCLATYDRTRWGWVELELIRTDTEKPVPVSAASLHLQGSERLLVGRDASAQKLFDNALIQSAVWALLGALGLSIATGWLLTRLIFSRISDISRTADTIVSNDLTRRVPIRGTGDELDQLSLTLNEMLDRISDLIDNLKMTTTSLSHDLRSPLTRLRSQLETLTEGSGDIEERERMMLRALEEVDRLLEIFNNLTEIARAEARLSRDDFDDVDLVSLVNDCVDLYAPVAAEQGIELTATGSAPPVAGHRHLLMQALSNLLENALRFAPEASSIVVSLRDYGEYIELTVSDEGCGLPDDFLGEALRPFTTANRSRTDGGTGLGLALVLAVARLHNGDVKLSNTNPGLRATVNLRTE
ncbi:MAG: ATP-binding protein, partial [Halioglobus sp.]